MCPRSAATVGAGGSDSADDKLLLRIRPGLGTVISPAFLQALARPATSKLLLFVIDGLGGAPVTPGGPTELEAARTLSLDRFAAEGVTGLSEPVGPGITPGSGPGHLALFGYDPIENQIGRGALSALGLGVELAPGDIAIRLNFATLDSSGNVADRRAGRIPTDLNRRLVQQLNTIELDGVRATFLTESEHRAVLILSGDDLDADVRETDPQAAGVPPINPDPLSSPAQRTSRLLIELLQGVRDRIGDETPANFVLMRGYAARPALRSLGDLYGLRARCFASYPMYKGLASAVGMSVADTGDTLEGQFGALEHEWGDFDYFFFHVKKTDALGEDKDFAGKLAYLEVVDELLPRVRELAPNVLVVTGDHSTPAALGAHSWHPVPLLLWGDHVVADAVTEFGERPCAQGALGTLPARSIMSLMLAHGERLAKFGA